MSLSVIMPNYNHAEWLPQALRALLQQSVPADEIILVDDGSTDDSVHIVETFQRSHPSLRLIRHEANRGALAAGRTGIAAATGDFLLFAAADDFVLPGLFERATAALQTHRSAAFFCSEVVVLGRLGEIRGFRPVMIPREEPGYVPPAEALRDICASDNWFVGTSVVYRHSHLRDIGYFDPSLGALCDAMATRLLAFRHGFYFTPEVLATWRVMSDSLSGRASLSLAENERMLSVARGWMAEKFPLEAQRTYPPLFEQRLRFNFARQRLVWAGGSIDREGIVSVMQWGRFDRLVLRMLSAIPGLASKLMLVWLTLRARPYGVGVLMRSFWRNLTLNRKRRHALQAQLAGGP